MLCDACGEKAASIHLTQVVNEEVKKIHLCEECAADSGLDVNSPLSLTDVLLGLGGQKESDPQMPDKTCPVCQMRFSDFKKTSRLGCQNCYDTFARELAPLLDGMHKGNQHVGKVPAKNSGKARMPPGLLALKSALQAAIASENYEEAAQVRDRILRYAEKRGSEAGG